MLSNSLMNIRCSLIQAGFLGLVMLFMPVAVRAQFIYTIHKGEVAITGYTGSDEVVTIPGLINNLPVTSIGNHAFNNCYERLKANSYLLLDSDFSKRALWLFHDANCYP